MKDEEVAVKIAEHEEKLKVANNRIADLEEQGKMMYDLIANVKSLSEHIDRMVSVQEKQGQRIEEIEKKPGEDFKRIKWICLTALCSGVFGAVISNLGTILGAIK